MQSLLIPLLRSHTFHRMLSFCFLSFLSICSASPPPPLWPFLNDEWSSRYKKLTVVERERRSVCETCRTHPSTNWVFVLNFFSLLLLVMVCGSKTHIIAEKYGITVDTGWTCSSVVALLQGKAILLLITRKESKIHNILKARYSYRSDCRGICFGWSWSADDEIASLL